MSRKVSIWYYGITFVLLVALFWSVPVGAQAEGFIEDFESPEPEGWELAPDVIVVHGALRLSPGHYAFRIGEWDDFMLEVQVRSTGPGEIMLHYYARDESRYMLLILPEEIILLRSMGESEEILGSAGTEALQAGDWIDVAIRVINGEHQISIEGEQIIDAADPEPLPPGAIGFMFHGEGYAEVDNLEVTFLGVSAEGEGVPEGGERHPPEEGERQIPEGEEGPHPGAEKVMPPEGDSLTGAQESQDQAGTDGTGSWLEEFLTGQAQPLELQTFVINLFLSAVLAFILGRVYIHWGTSLSNRRKFASNFMLITITTTFIILVVRSSVALSLGLVGALSIVRFRAAIKEPEELAYLFFAIGIGIGLGDNQRLITLLAMVAGILIIGIVRLFHTREADVNLHLSVASGNPEKVDLEAIMDTLDTHCAKLKLLRFDESDEAMEASFLVEFRALEKLQEARRALKTLSPSLEITFLDNQGIG
jgi:hypothetical protein